MDEHVTAKHLCPDCGAEMVLEGEQRNLGGRNAFAPQLLATVYACPQCGRLLFYDYFRLYGAKLKAAQAATDNGDQPKDAPAGDPWEKNKDGLFGRFKNKD